MITKIVSGGQTGVDRAALDVAIRLGIPCGGWCPKGRLAEDGRISRAYPLEETPTSEYAERTMWNVRDTEGTLVLAFGPPAGGTAYTIACTRILNRPCSVVDLAKNDSRVAPVVQWISDERIGILNVAGPRESTAPGIRELAMQFLLTLLGSSAARETSA